MRAAAIAVSILLGAYCTSLPKGAAHEDLAVAGSTMQPTITRETWHDTKRDRDVAVTIYAPADAHNAPVVVFSHGIGEDRDSYAYLGRALAGAGFLAVHVTHAGTDRAVLGGLAERAVFTPLYDHFGVVEAVLGVRSAGTFTVLALAKGTPSMAGRCAIRA